MLKPVKTLDFLESTGDPPFPLTCRAEKTAPSPPEYLHAERTQAGPESNRRRWKAAGLSPQRAPPLEAGRFAAECTPAAERRSRMSFMASFAVHLSLSLKEKPDAKRSGRRKICRLSSMQNNGNVVRPMFPSQRGGRSVLRRKSNGLDNEHYNPFVKTGKPFAPVFVLPPHPCHPESRDAARGIGDAWTWIGARS